jgi:tetratricopeptide (TPR) repeat protein
VVAVVSACAAAAAGIAVGGALLQGGEGSAAPREERTAEPPPLELAVLPGEPQAAALREAEAAYDEGRRAEAAAAFDRVLAEDPGSLEASVGAALASWPEGTVPELERLADEEPDSALVHLHLGLARIAAGDAEAARQAWRLAVERDPDTQAAVQADSLLHPDIAPGLPLFLPSRPLPGQVRRLRPLEQVEALRERASGGAAMDRLLLGSLLQRLGRPVSARAAFDRAAEAHPQSLEAQVAAAVGRFDKDDPSQAFSRLGPLSREHPRAAVVRFHLGLMLLWIRGVDEAERQLTTAIQGEPGTVYAREARKLLTTLAQS